MNLPTESSVLHFILESRSCLYLCFHRNPQEVSLVYASGHSLRKEYLSLSNFLEKLEEETREQLSKLLIQGLNTGQIHLKFLKQARRSKVLEQSLVLAETRESSDTLECLFLLEKSNLEFKEELLNLKRVQSLKDDFEEEFAQVYQEICEEFFMQAEEILECLDHAIKSQNWQEGANKSHLLKGASSNVGFETIHQTSLQLELAFSELSPVQVEALYHELEELIEKTKNYLKRIQYQV